MKKRNQTCGEARSSANTRSDERRKTLSLVTAVIMAVSCIACVIIKAVRKDCFSVHEILLYAAWALLAAESFLAAFSNGSRINMHNSGGAFFAFADNRSADLCFRLKGK